MSWRLTRAVARLGALCLLAAAPAMAQPKPPAGDPAQAEEPAKDERTAQAEAHFRRGVKLFQDKNFSGALAEFEAAYRFKPGPSSLKNVALSQKALFRYAEAAETLKQVLARHNAELSEDERAQIRAAIEELSALVGSIVIRVNAPKARVTLNGKTLSGKQLSGPISLNVGEYTVAAEAPGYAGASRTVRVAGGQDNVPVELSLEAVGGTVTVVAQHEDDAIAIDRKERAFHTWTGSLPAGQHYVQVYRQGYEQYQQNFVVEVGGQLRIDAPALEEDDADPTPVGPRLPQRGFYALGALTGMGLRNDAQDLDINNSEASGGSFGVRAGYRVWTPVGVEALVEGGRHEIKGACDDAAQGTDCYERDLTLDSVRLGGNIRIMSSGEKLRFTSTLGVGAVRHELTLPDRADDAPPGAQLGGTAKGWDPYFMLEVGGQYNWGHILLEACGVVFIDGASNVVGSREDGTHWAPYEDSGGLLMVGFGLRAGWSEWAPPK